MSIGGKVSRVGSVRYTPAGMATLEFTIAVSQTHFDKKTVGYFEVLVVGEDAASASTKLCIGKSLLLSGKLWMRSYRDHQGIKSTETKIIGEKIAFD